MSIIVCHEEKWRTLTFPCCDRLAEENERSADDQIVVPAKVVPQVSRVYSQTHEDERKDCKHRNDGEYLILPTLHHDVLSKWKGPSKSN